ncbi:dTDP-4-dehydrorhamnose reductase [Corynebacterium sphenisci]|uniref:dTDP-4-dehydrorhamnose reductase n=1 Tax=Corynebacterium sphenisci TaxID=191493 RepID=UPI0026E02915|nr:dTDP-4-dehydrorhamnose reductase [Corynebacterium sphenisci]MDO5730734.1 dTDP-4-dehydrorhamnose reductase [Corynebacterium sphenisci]
MPHSGILCVGAGGQLGRALADLGVPGLTRAELDLRDAAAVVAHPGIAAAAAVINCAAYTDVDGAEADPAAAWAVNRDGAAHLARACAAAGTRLVHVSTDYVFGGAAAAGAPADPAGRAPLPVDAPTAPETVYGASKLAGERAVRAAAGDHLVVRTAWVFNGRERDFVSAMVRLAAGDAPVRVVADQHGNPTYVRDLAAGLLQAARGAARGTVHCTGSGATTWYGLARAVFARIGADPDRVRPCTTAEFPRPAPRPAWSVLDGSSWTAAGLDPLPGWRDGLARALP